MKIGRAEVFLIRLPLRLTVRHALAARRESLNLIVRLTDDEGREGWGEGIPREYVTGEIPETAFRHLEKKLLPSLLGVSIEGPDDLLPAVSRLLAPSAGNQSCCCAAELALFDLAGKAFNRSAATWFGGLRRDTVHYSAVLPLLSPAETWAFLDECRSIGIPHLKIKTEGESWPETLAAARTALGNGVTITVDANGSWDAESAAAHLRRMEPDNVAWVEQPLPRGQEHEIAGLAGRSFIPLMADESLTTMDEAERLAGRNGYGLFNLRLSKLGGLVASHRIARFAGDHGVRLQVGCQVGETSILSAAGRLLAATLPRLDALEGSFGSRLLKRDVSDTPYEFGPGGAAAVQRSCGLGALVDPQQVASLVLRSVALQEP